ncbi:MAG: hypothetical protein ABWX84_13090 [Nocardioides sp.]
MSEFQFDPDAIAPLPAGLRAQQAALLAVTTLPSPDTGGSTAATAEAVRRLSAAATSLAGRLDSLADDVDECLTVYAEVDDDVFQALELRMAGALS